MTEPKGVVFVIDDNDSLRESLAECFQFCPGLRRDQICPKCFHLARGERVGFGLARLPKRNNQINVMSRHLAPLPLELER